MSSLKLILNYNSLNDVMIQNELADKIINGEKMIYIFRVIDGKKSPLIDNLNNSIKITSISPDIFRVYDDYYDQDYEDEEYQISEIAEKIRNFKYILIQPDNLNNLSPRKLKEMVHGDMFIRYEDFTRRKLIIVTEEDSHDSIFNSGCNRGLRHRTEFM